MIRAIIALLFAALFLIITLPYIFIVWLISKKHPDRAYALAAPPAMWGLRVVSFLCSVHLNVSGLENIPKDRSVLYIGNHSSIFDVILTYPLSPRPTGYLAKKEMTKVPVFKLWMDVLFCLTLDRNDTRQALGVILKAIDYEKQGRSVFIFPEGTRTKDGTLGAFHAGSFKVALRSGCPVIPVAITHTAEIIRDHIPFVKTTAVNISYGSPIETKDLSAEEKKHLANNVRDIISGMLDEMD